MKKISKEFSDEEFSKKGLEVFDGEFFARIFSKLSGKDHSDGEFQN
jgi:hypothetical protein